MNSHKKRAGVLLAFLLVALACAQGAFALVDGYEDGDYTADPVWTVDTGTGATASVQGTTVYDGNYSLKFTTDGTNDNAWYKFDTPMNTSALTVGQSYSTMVRISDLTSTRADFHLQSTNEVDFASILFFGGKIIRSVSGGAGNADLVASPSANTWYNFTIVYQGSTVDFYVYNSTGGLLGSETSVGDGSTDFTNFGQVQLRTRDQTGSAFDTYFDLTKYSGESEPVDDGGSGGSTTNHSIAGFEDGDFTNNPTWTAETTAAGAGEVTTDQGFLGNYSFKITTEGTNDQAFTKYYNTDYNLTTGENVSAMIRYSKVDGGARGGFGIKSSSGTDFALITLNGGNIVRSVSGGGGESTLVASASVDTWYNLTIVDQGATVDFYVFNSTGGLLGSETSVSDGSTDFTNFDRTFLEARDDASVAYDVFFDEIHYALGTAGDGGGLPFNGSSGGNESGGSSSSESVDTFEDGDYTSSPVWTVDDSAGGSASVQTSVKQAGSYALSITTDGANDDAWFEMDTPLNASHRTDGKEFSAMVYITDAANGRASYRLQSSDEADFGQILFFGGNIIRSVSGGGGESTLVASPSSNTWYNFTIVYHNDTLDFYVYSEAGSLLGSSTSVGEGTSEFEDFNEIRMQVRDQTGTAFTTYYDNVVYGSEFNEAPNITVNSPASGSKFNLTSSVLLNVSVEDATDNMTVTWKEASSDSFKFVVMPDTQDYTLSSGDALILQNVTEYIAGLNPSFVAHVGDFVELATPQSQTRWGYVNDSIVSDLIDGDIPFIGIPGNHDYDGGSATHNTTTYNQYLPISKFNTKSWWGGSENASKSENSYMYFTAGGQDYMVAAVEYCPTDSDLDWLNSTVSGNSDYETIIVTHRYTEEDGTRDTKSGTCANGGTDIWNKVVKHHENIFMVLSGHWHGTSTQQGLNTATGINGNTVYEIHQNFQDTSESADGYIRIYDFDPNNNQINVSTYSPYENAYLTDGNNEFTLSYTQDAVLNTITNQPNGTYTYNWTNLTRERTYSWLATVSDGSSTISSSAYTFLIENLVPQITANTSGTTSSSRADVGETITFQVNGTDGDSDNVTLRICSDNTGYASCTQICEQTTAVQFDDVTENSISCTYAAQQSDDSSNTYYAYLNDGFNSTSTSGTYHVNHQIQYTNFSAPNLAGNDTLFVGESVDYIQIDITDQEDASSSLSPTLTVKKPDGTTVYSGAGMAYDSGNTHRNTTDISLDQSGNWTVNITATDSDGLVSTYDTTFNVLSNAPEISNEQLSLNNLQIGNQSFLLNFDFSDANDDAIVDCGYERGGVKYNTTNSMTATSCSINVTELFNSTSNFTFKTYATDENDQTGYGTTYQGLTISYSHLNASSTSSTTTTQYFDQIYNITNPNEVNFTGVNWSRNATDSNTMINLTANATTSHAKQVNFSMVTLGSYGYTPNASGIYYVDEGYEVFRNYTLNYTSSQYSTYGALPDFKLHYSATRFVDGGSSAYFNGSSALNTSANTMVINVTGVDAAGAYDGNITHLSKIVYSTFNVTYTDSGDARTWKFDRGGVSGKRIDFMFSHPTFPINSSTEVRDFMNYSELSNWTNKDTYTQSVKDNSGITQSSIFLDNDVGLRVQQSWNLSSSDTFYVYFLTWTDNDGATSSGDDGGDDDGGSSGGGGGGGGGITLIGGGTGGAECDINIDPGIVRFTKNGIKKVDVFNGGSTTFDPTVSIQDQEGEIAQYLEITNDVDLLPGDDVELGIKYDALNFTAGEAKIILSDSSCGDYEILVKASTGLEAINIVDELFSEAGGFGNLLKEPAFSEEQEPLRSQTPFVNVGVIWALLTIGFLALMYDPFRKAWKREQYLKAMTWITFHIGLGFVGMIFLVTMVRLF